MVPFSSLLRRIQNTLSHLPFHSLTFSSLRDPSGSLFNCVTLLDENIVWFLKAPQIWRLFQFKVWRPGRLQEGGGGRDRRWGWNYSRLYYLLLNHKHHSLKEPWCHISMPTTQNSLWQVVKWFPLKINRKDCLLHKVNSCHGWAIIIVLFLKKSPLCWVKSVPP